MPEQRNALDVGFADFVAVLLVETLESIVAAHTNQEEKLASLHAAARLSVEEFAQTGISGELLDASAVRLFPDGEGGTTLIEGGPVPEKDALEELDVELASGDSGNDGLTARGVARIRDALALYLARRQLDAVREADARGIPRVHVEGGVLRAKLNFTAVDTTPSTDPQSAAEPVLPEARGPGEPLRSRGDAPLRIRGGIRNELIAWDSPLQAGVLDSIRRTRLVVSTPPTQPPGGEPEPTSRTEVFGEVEIRFRAEG